MPKKHRIQLGDIVEIPTARGLSYIQYVFNHDFGQEDSNHGPIIRVLSGVFPSRPMDFMAIAAQPEQFIGFFLVDWCVKRGYFEVVGSAPVPERFGTMPLFRIQGLPHMNTGKTGRWWIWDGMHRTVITEYTDELLQLPVREIICIPELIDRIENNYRSGQEGWNV